MPGDSGEIVAAFRKGLCQMVFVEGQNVITAFRYAEGRCDLVSTRDCTSQAYWSF